MKDSDETQQRRNATKKKEGESDKKRKTDAIKEDNKTTSITSKLTRETVVRGETFDSSSSKIPCNVMNNVLLLLSLSLSRCLRPSFSTRNKNMKKRERVKHGGAAPTTHGGQC
ncbi:unnamed protein product [Ectocarpus sp. 12 AP-2014]